MCLELSESDFLGPSSSRTSPQPSGLRPRDGSLPVLNFRSWWNGQSRWLLDGVV